MRRRPQVERWSALPGNRPRQPVQPQRGPREYAHAVWRAAALDSSEDDQQACPPRFGPSRLATGGRVEGVMVGNSKVVTEERATSPHGTPSRPTSPVTRPSGKGPRNGRGHATAQAEQVQTLAALRTQSGQCGRAPRKAPVTPLRTASHQHHLTPRLQLNRKHRHRPESARCPRTQLLFGFDRARLRTRHRRTERTPRLTRSRPRPCRGVPS